MSTTLGQSALERQNSTFLGERMPSAIDKDYSEQTAREVDLEIRALLDEGYSRATALLEGRRADLDAGALLLLEKGTLTPEEFPPIMPIKALTTFARLIVTRPWGSVSMTLSTDHRALELSQVDQCTGCFLGVVIHYECLLRLNDWLPRPKGFGHQYI